MSKKRNILIIVNPAAGKSSYESRLTAVKERLLRAKIVYLLFFTEAQCSGKLSSYLNENPVFDDLIVMGGDGTLNYVVNEIHGLNLPVSIISNGTGNDSVKSIHGVLNFEQQLKIALQGNIVKFDLGVCNGRYFVNGVGIGFDGLVLKEMVERGDKKGRHIDYLLTVIRIIGGFKEKSLRFVIDRKRYEKTILLMTISNGTTFGGGFVINPFAKTNDGKLDVCIFNEISPLKRFWHLPKLRTGTHTKIKENEFYQAREINVEQTSELVAHMDGEYIGHPPFNIHIEKDAIKFRVPS